MSKLLEDTPSKELSYLLDQIQERDIALPDFQRDFVWEPYATQELIVSIARDYPAGSLLAIRNTKDYFASRAIEGAPELNGHKATYLILDGQQRLTSMYQAFYGVGEYRYFLRLRALLAGEDIEDCLFYAKVSAKKGQHFRDIKRYETLDGQFEDLVLPLSVLFGTDDGYIGWCDTMTERIEDSGGRQSLRKQLMELRKEHINNIEHYKFPVVLLSDSTPEHAVCSIFETLNRTGVKLGVFDLLTARFWTKKVDLRQLWQASANEYDLFEDYEIDPYYLLQCACLLRENVAPSCKRKDVLGLDADHVQLRWSAVSAGMDRALTIMREDCGVLVSKWVPYSTMLVPLAAVLADVDVKGMDEGAVRRKLVRWFWCAVFSQQYEKSPNSQAAKDFNALRKWLAGGPEPDAVAQFSFDEHTLYDITPRQRALYRGMIALVLSQRPRDFHTHAPIESNLIVKDHIDDHHIFPDAYLLKTKRISESKKRECVLNRTLIDRSTNHRLSKTDPKTYFTSIRKSMGDTKYEALLRSHLLDDDAAAGLIRNDYDAFLAARATKLNTLVQGATSN